MSSAEKHKPFDLGANVVLTAMKIGINQ